MNKTHANRILAVDLRARRLGYAVLESPRSLLAHGNSQFDTTTTVRRRMRLFFNNYRPSIIVLDRGAIRGPRDRRWTAQVIQAVRAASSPMSIPVMVIPAETVRAFFADYGVRNKYALAELLAKWFPRLADRVLPERKCYDPEPWITAWFDAIAIGTVHLAKSNQESAEFFRRSLGDE